MYARALGRKLKEVCDEIVASEGRASAESPSLHNEMLVVRSVAFNRVDANNRMRDNAIAMHEANPKLLSAERLAEIERIADENIFEAAKHVRDMGLAQAKILTAGKMDITEVRVVMHQFTGALDEWAAIMRQDGQDPTRMIEFITERMDEVRVPKGVTIIEQAVSDRENTGMTALSPADADAEMRAMIGTVPYVQQAELERNSQAEAG